MNLNSVPCVLSLHTCFFQKLSQASLSPFWVFAASKLFIFHASFPSNTIGQYAYFSFMNKFFRGMIFISKSPSMLCNPFPGELNVGTYLPFFSYPYDNTVLWITSVGFLGIVFAFSRRTRWWWEVFWYHEGTFFWNMLFVTVGGFVVALSWSEWPRYWYANLVSIERKL